MIHFPIVLLITATVIDLVDVVFERPRWLGGLGTTFVAAGAVAAVAAYLTGAQAGSTVWIPGMAHPLVEAHRTWALITVWYFGFLATLRIAATLVGIPRTRVHRIVLLAFGLAGIALLQQTTERGGRLVYEQGVGVIAAPPSR